MNVLMLMENFRNFISEDRITKKNDFREIKIQIILIISNNASLLKTEIVSHIRAILGVTRVDIIESFQKPYFYITKLVIKIDTEPFGLMSTEKILLFVKQQITKINGIKRTRFGSRPEIYKK